MKLGLTLSNQMLPTADPGRILEDLIEQTEVARDSGFDSVWVLHHRMAPLPVLQPLELLARLAPVSGEMALGTNIFIGSLSHPLELAESVSTIDAITGGRLILGLGLGYRPEEFETFGVPLNRRASRTDEMVEIMRRFWAGEDFEHEGKNWKFKVSGGLRIPRGGPPIWFGGGTSAAIARAARIGDAHIVVPTRSHDLLPESFEATRLELRALGRPLDREYPVLREAAVSAGPEGLEAARQAMFREAEIYAEAGAPVYSERIQGILDNAAVFGDVAQATRTLARIQDMGCTHLITRCQWAGLPQAHVLETIRLLGTEVWPLLAERQPTAPVATPVS